MSDPQNGISASFGNQSFPDQQSGGQGAQVSASFSMGSLPAQNATTGAPQPVRDITTAQFMDEVVQASQSQPVLVDFWAPWCGPCKQLAPVLEKVVAERKGDVKLVKMNIDDHPEVAQQMRIQSIPAVVAFKGGQPADAFMGNKSESEIRAFIEKLAGKTEEAGSLEAAIQQGEELMRAGEIEAAANIFISILQQKPDHTPALVGLGMAHLANDDVEAAQSALDAIGEQDRSDPLVASLAAAIELKEQAGNIGDLKELMDAVESDGDNHQARFDLAIGLNAKGKRAEAAEHLLEIIKRDRQWNQDGAKTQLLQFFEAWGPMDEATKNARRKLSAVLFS